MKFTITLKSPDAVYQALRDFPEDQREEMEKFADEFLRYGEYARIEFDTEKKTATVLRNS